MLVALIMAGGKGERFWPRSRSSLPKQFLDLTGNGTLIQLTCQRTNRIVGWDKTFIVSGPEYVDLIKEQVPELPEENIIVEPEGKNTAPCIGLAAHHIIRKYPEAIMVTLPSDHYIKESDQFCAIVLAATRIANQDENIVTLGINPTRPETGYGYIEIGSPYDTIDGFQCHISNCFVEKPDLVTAKQYLQQGNYLWNSGIFVWKVNTILKLFNRFAPNLANSLSIIEKHWGSEDYHSILCNEYGKLEKVSIDYSILEKATSVFVFPSQLTWDDVGCWTSLERVSEPDSNGNVIKGQVIPINTKRCIIEGNERVIATLGIEDLIVVDADDIILICPKTEAQNIRTIIQNIKEKGLEVCL